MAEKIIDISNNSGHLHNLVEEALPGLTLNFPYATNILSLTMSTLEPEYHYQFLGKMNAKSAENDKDFSWGEGQTQGGFYYPTQAEKERYVNEIVLPAHKKKVADEFNTTVEVLDSAKDIYKQYGTLNTSTILDKRMPRVAVISQNQLNGLLESGADIPSIGGITKAQLLNGTDRKTPEQMQAQYLYNVRAGLERNTAEDIINKINENPQLFSPETIADYMSFSESPLEFPEDENRPRGQSGAVLTEPVFGAGVGTGTEGNWQQELLNMGVTAGSVPGTKMFNEMKAARDKARKSGDDPDAATVSIALAKAGDSVKTARYVNPETGTSFVVPVGSETEQNLKNLGYTQKLGEEVSAAGMEREPMIDFKEGLSDEQKQSIKSLVSSGREFNEKDAKNFAYATGEEDWEQFVGKSGESIDEANFAGEGESPSLDDALLKYMSEAVNWDTLSVKGNEDAQSNANRPYGKVRSEQSESQTAMNLKAQLLQRVQQGTLPQSAIDYLNENDSVWNAYIDAATYGSYNMNDIQQDLIERDSGTLGTKLGGGRGIINPSIAKDTWMGVATPDSTATQMQSGTQSYGGQAPFKPGLSENQQTGINKLLEKDQWNAVDLQNWNYATNSAPLPIGVQAPKIDSGKWVGVNYNGQVYSGYVPGNRNIMKGKENITLDSAVITDLFKRYQKRAPSEEDVKFWEGKTAGDLEEMLSKTMIFPNEQANKIREQLQEEGQLYIRNPYELERLRNAGIISDESLTMVGQPGMLFTPDGGTQTGQPSAGEEPSVGDIVGGDAGTQEPGTSQPGDQTPQPGSGDTDSGIIDWTEDIISGYQPPEFEELPSPRIDLEAETDPYYDWILNDLKAQTAIDRTDARKNYEISSERTAVNKAQELEQAQGQYAIAGLYGSGQQAKAQRQGIEQPYEDKFTDIRREWFRGAAPSSEIDRLPESELRRLGLGMYTEMPDRDMTPEQIAQYGAYPAGYNVQGQYPGTDQTRVYTYQGNNILLNGQVISTVGSPEEASQIAAQQAQASNATYNGAQVASAGQVQTATTGQPQTGQVQIATVPDAQQGLSGQGQTVSPRTSQGQPYPGQIGPYESGNLGVYQSSRDSARKLGYLTPTGAMQSKLDVDYLGKKREFEDKERQSIFSTKLSDWQRRQGKEINPDTGYYPSGNRMTPSTTINTPKASSNVTIY